MYITTNAADVLPSLDMRVCGSTMMTVFLMSKCKQHLMDSSVVRETVLTQFAGITQLSCHAWMWQQMLWRKIIIHLLDSWWDDQDMASDVLREHETVSATTEPPCFHRASYWSWFIEHECVRENLGSVSVLRTGIQFSRKQKQWHPDLSHLKKIMSALWNLSSCRQF